MGKGALRSVLAAYVGLCLLAPAARAQSSSEELVDNPGYKSWAGHKVGTAVTYDSTTDAAGQQFKMQMTQKLTELTKEKAVIEVTTKIDIAGAPPQPPQKQEVKAKVKKSEIVGTGTLPPGVKGEAKEKGKEKIEVAGKSYECQVWEFTGEANGVKTSGKSWTSDKIPGTLAKMESSAEVGGQKMKTTMAMTKIETK